MSTEAYTKHLMECYFVPALHKVLRSADPEKYEKWQGNCCRQTAVFAVPLLEWKLPEYTWTAWDGWFEDVVQGRPVTYNHAWVYGVNKSEGRRLLVDLSRQHHERLFLSVSSNRYPRDIPGYEHMKEIRREHIDMEVCMQEKEFYTKRSSPEVLDDIKREMALMILI